MSSSRQPPLPDERPDGKSSADRSGVLGRRAVLCAGLLAGLAGCASDKPHAADRAVGTRRPPAAPAQTGAPPSPGVAPTAAPPSLGAEVVSGPRSRPAVALTFHGAGDAGIAVSLLTVAESAGARLTVLAVGTWLDANRPLAARILDGGHELGNHTYTHPVLTGLGARAVHREIAQCAEVLRRLTGSTGRWFRPSGTARATPLIEAQARRAGYPTCLAYDVDPRDYSDPGAPAVVARVLAGVRPGSIVSLHLGHRGTLDAMPDILGGLHRRRLLPVTVSDLLAVNHATARP